MRSGFPPRSTLSNHPMPGLSTKQKIAIATCASRVVRSGRRIFGKASSGGFTRHGIRWELDLREGIDFAIWLFGHFEPDAYAAYRKRLKPDDVVLDIGANIGAHALPLAQCVAPGGKVLAFEPTVYAFKKLQRHRELNPELGKVLHAQQILLMDSPTAAVPATIASAWPLEETDGLHPDHFGRPESTAGARAAMLDEIVRDEPRIDFIKLDVDGHELAVLRGARATLARCKPPILIELCPQVCVEHHHTFAELVGELTGAGYRFERFDGRALPNDPDALERLIPPKGGLNAMALPA